MYCTQCGQSNRDTAKFCTACGSALRARQKPPPNIEPLDEPLDGLQEDKTSPWKAIKALSLITLITLMVILAVRSYNAWFASDIGQYSVARIIEGMDNEGKTGKGYAIFLKTRTGDSRYWNSVNDDPKVRREAKEILTNLFVNQELCYDVFLVNVISARGPGLSSYLVAIPHQLAHDIELIWSEEERQRTAYLDSLTIACGLGGLQREVKYRLYISTHWRWSDLWSQLEKLEKNASRQ